MWAEISEGEEEGSFGVFGVAFEHPLGFGGLHAVGVEAVFFGGSEPTGSSAEFAFAERGGDGEFCGAVNAWD